MSLAEDLHYLDLLAVSARIRSRQLSSREVTEAQLLRMAALDGRLHSYALQRAEAARLQAGQADAEIAAGQWRGPLHGVPIAVKDLCWVQGEPTAAGMAVHRDFRPDEDATVVRRLKAAGAVLLGKTQLTEGAYSDYHASIVAPVNPWGAAHWPGISSSGSAVATAAGLCYGAVATDTGGSIRWPAAANGVTGLKPGWGRVSRHGVFELAASLDHVGTIARSARDAGALLAVMAGADPKDPSALRDPVPALRGDDADAGSPQGLGGLGGLRIGVDPQWNSDGVDPATQGVLAQAREVLRELGAQFIEIRFPDATQAVADWAPLCAVEAAVAHEASYSAHRDRYGPVLSAVIAAGQALSGIEHQKILLRRMALRGRVDALFEGIDLLLTPVQPFAAPTLATIQTLGEQPALVAMLQRYTCPFNLTGHPTITLPGGFTADGMPIGFQLVAAHRGEALLVDAGAACQHLTNWHRRHPLP